MPLQNRVTPFGDLVTVNARGTMFGNRGGMFHDPASRTLGARRWANRRWLCCSLTFSGSHRHPVWSRGYTQLFFLDEVTALAAGHRPCAECRRPDAMRFRKAAERGTGEAITSLEALDCRLHAERLAPTRARLPARSLPGGSMYAQGRQAFAVRNGAALAWSSTAYRAAGPVPAGTVEVLTPPTTLAALRAGFMPVWHRTATEIVTTGVVRPSQTG